MAYPRNKERLEKFADWLKKQMIRAGFESQRQFAIAANISPASISRIVQAKQLPDEETIKKMAPALNCQFGEVMSQAGYGRYTERRIMDNAQTTICLPAELMDKLRQEAHDRGMSVDEILLLIKKAFEIEKPKNTGKLHNIENEIVIFEDERYGRWMCHKSVLEKGYKGIKAPIRIPDEIDIEEYIANLKKRFQNN